MDKPKFTHDCNACQFLGHFEGHDVYICPSDMPSIIARYGNEGPEYSSTLVKLFQARLKENGIIHRHDGSKVSFRDYALNGLNRQYKAFVLALATR